MHLYLIMNLVQTFLGVNWGRQIGEQQADPE